MSGKPAKTAQEAGDYHDLEIHLAKKRCKQVGYKGAKYWVADLCDHKGDVEMVVYLEGVAGEVRPCEITILEK